MAGTVAQQAYTDLKSSLTARTEQAEIQRRAGEGAIDIAEIETQEARRRGYSSAEEAKTAGEIDLVSAQDMQDLREAQAEETRRGQFARYDITEEQEEEAKRRALAGYTEEGRTAVEQREAEAQQLIQQLAGAKEAGTAAYGRAAIEEQRAQEAARAGRETLSQNVLSALEKEERAGAEYDISESVRAEAERAGMAGVELTEQEAQAARDRSLAALEEERFGKEVDITSLLGEYIGSAQQQALRLLEMGATMCESGQKFDWATSQCVPDTGDEAVVCDPPCDPDTQTCTDGVCVALVITNRCNPPCVDPEQCINGTCVDPNAGMGCEDQCKALLGNPDEYGACITTCEGTNTDICTPDCTGKSCGPDGCDGECGVCESPNVCVNGECVTPDSSRGKFGGGGTVPQPPIPPTTPGYAYGGTVPQGSFLNDMLVQGFGGRR
jgi:hypothetical protein